MTNKDALDALGLPEGVTYKEIATAASHKKKNIEEKISAAPTDALKAKFQIMLDKVIEAEHVLLQTKKTKSRSPLSETKMAGLPSTVAIGATSVYHLKIGDSLSHDRYEIKEQIGEGGMGSVYLAYDKSRDEDIAIKVLLPSLLKNEHAKERFLNEARLSSQLSHPNIINVYDVQQDGEFYFLTMELLEGQDLRQVMENHKLSRQPFSLDEVKKIIGAVSEGLVYAHQHTVHRNIKPENIWLTEDGNYKIMGFGIARVQPPSQRTQTGIANYMAPEQVKGAKDINGHADQYALAVLAYELLSGEVPAGMIEPIQQHRKDAPKAMANAIHQALALRPENRFADIKLFNEALNKKDAGLILPSLSYKTLGIAAGILLSLGLVGSIISSGGLSGLLPESAEVIQAQKTSIYKLQGEINSLKQRLENSRRDLQSKINKAERNSRQEELSLLNNWLQLVTRTIFESPKISRLQRYELVGEGMLRDKDYKVALAELKRIKFGYQSLLNTFDASKETLIFKVSTLPDAERKWGEYKTKYDLSTPNKILQAQLTTAYAEKAYRAGELIKAKELYKEALGYYEEAVKVDSVVRQVQIKLDEQARRIAEGERVRSQ